MEQLHNFNKICRKLCAGALFVLVLIMCSSFAQNSNGIAQKVFRIKHAKSLRFLTAKLGKHSKIILEWSAPKDIEVSHFILQRSDDGINFTDRALIFTPEKKVNFIKTYNYADKINSFDDDTIYYRLKIQDTKGNYFYSDVAIVVLNTQDNQFA